MAPIMEQKAQRVFDNPHFTFEHIRKKELEKFTEDFRIIYNQAWGRYTGVKEITTAHARALMKSIGPILDEKLMWFGYHDGEPVGFFLMIPEINDIVKHLHGKMNLWGKLKFLFYQKTHACDTALGLIFGIIPKHQGKGVEGGLVYSFAGEALKRGFPYKYLELNWIGDFNPTMIKVAEQIGGKPIKTHVTFRYLFDRNKPFTRAKKVS
jgi:GNAT superfamily N-acetyltransferase